MATHPHDDLSAYLDGELTDAEAAELEAELARDPELRGELAEIESVVQFVRREGAEAAPFGFHRRVMDRIEAEHPPRSSWAAWWRKPLGLPLEGWVVAAAAAAVLLFVLPRGQVGVGPDWEPVESESPAAAKLPAVEPVVKDAPAADPAPAKGAPAGKRAGTAEEGVETTLPTRPQALSPALSTKGEVPEPAPAKGEADVPEEVLAPIAPTGEGSDARSVSPTGYRVTLSASDPNMKRRVMALASRFGRPVQLDGSEPTSAAFQGSEESLLVEIPQRQLLDFESSLRKLGYRISGMDDRQLLKGGSVVVRLDMVFESRATKKMARPEPASEEGSASSAPGE